VTYQNNGGSWAHNSDGIDPSGNAYIDSGHKPEVIGLASTGNGLGVGFKTAPAAADTVAIGAYGDASTYGQIGIYPRYTGATSYHRFGSEGFSSLNANTDALGAGIRLISRTSNANAAVYHYTWATQAFTTVVSTSSFNNTTFPVNTNTYYHALNVLGTPAGFQPEPTYFFIEHSGLSAAEAELFCIEIHALLIAWGITP
jgi:hypothetical protein